MDDRSDEEVEPVGVGHFDGGGQVGRARVQEAAGGVGNAGHLVITASEILFSNSIFSSPIRFRFHPASASGAAACVGKSKQT